MWDRRWAAAPETYVVDEGISQDVIVSRQLREAKCLLLCGFGSLRRHRADSRVEFERCRTRHRNQTIRTTDKGTEKQSRNGRRVLRRRPLQLRRGLKRGPARHTCRNQPGVAVVMCRARSIGVRFQTGQDVIKSLKTN